MNKREIWHEFVFDNSSVGEPRENYSGRNMYGKKVLAIVLDETDGDLRFAQELGAWLNENDHDYIPLATDSMGRGTIIYPRGKEYFEE